MNTKRQHQIQSNRNTTTSRSDWRISFPIFLLILAGVALTGCEVLQPPGENGQPSVRAPKYPPNYDTPEADFVPAAFGKLASEFIDEYENKYVVFECLYHSQHEGALLTKTGSIVNYEDMRTVTVTWDYKLLDVLWGVQDRELGRPFVDAKLNGKLKIYGYVLPAQKPWSSKARQDIYFKGFNMPVVLLIKAVPQ